MVIGSGFAGSVMAMIAHRLGYSTVLLERGKHPRFAIGESSTPLANLILEELGREFDLPFVLPLCKWGPWQKALPEIGCGLKRGFTFYQHQPGKRFEPDPGRERQLLVGASPNDNVADTHWYRAEFDKYLVQQACAMGLSYLDQVELLAMREVADGMEVEGRQAQQTVRFKAQLVIDASGPRGFVHRTLGIGERELPLLPRTQALFSHFREVGPLPAEFSVPGLAPPYPVEEAAVHHIFPGGWVWVLKFSNGITSAGVAATDKVARELGLSAGEAGWRHLLERLPSLRQMFDCAQAVVPFVHQPRIGFQSATIYGRHWAMLPSAVGVVDPLLSTGFPLTLLGVQRVARILAAADGNHEVKEGWNDYAQKTEMELEATARLVGALYANMGRFETFKTLSLLYFAAAIYSETARRSGKPLLAETFLLCGAEPFGSELKAICERACEGLSQAEARELDGRIRKLIAPYDLAGLSKEGNRPWHAALPEKFTI